MFKKNRGNTDLWRTFAFHEALEEGKKLGKALPSNTVLLNMSNTGWWFRNPANQLRLVVFPHSLQGFIHPRWLAGFLNHQQYYNEWSRIVIMQYLHVFRGLHLKRFKPSGHLAIVQVLLDQRASPNLQERHGATPLHFASKNAANPAVTSELSKIILKSLGLKS